MSTLDQLLSQKPAAPKKAGLTFLRTLATQSKETSEKKSKASFAMARRLRKMMVANGQTVSGVTVGADGTVTVTTTAATGPAASASVNPWDQELV